MPAWCFGASPVRPRGRVGKWNAARGALRRSLRRALTRAELFNGNRETFRGTFFSRESILLSPSAPHAGGAGTCGSASRAPELNALTVEPCDGQHAISVGQVFAAMWAERMRQGACVTSSDVLVAVRDADAGFTASELVTAAHTLRRVAANQLRVDGPDDALASFRSTFNR